MFKGIAHYWINRQQDESRRDFMQHWLRLVDCKAKRINAITPDTLPEIRFPKANQKAYQSGNSPTELACMSSHLKAILTAYSEGCEYAVILEDDVFALYDYDFSALLATAPTDWDMLQLVTINNNLLLKHFSMLRQHNILWQKWDALHWSTGCYLINRSAMKKVLARYCADNTTTLDTVDLTDVIKFGHLRADYVLYRYVNTYTSTFPLVCVNPQLGSSIHQRHIVRTHMPAYQTIRQVYAWLDQLADSTAYVPYVVSASGLSLPWKKSVVLSLRPWLRRVKHKLLPG